MRNILIALMMVCGTLQAKPFLSNSLELGDGANTKDKTIAASIGNANNPKQRWNHTTNQWEFSNDGVNFSALGTGSGGGC